MKFEVRKLTQWTWFNKLINNENYGSSLNIVIAYGLTIIDKLRKNTDISFINRNDFYLTIKVDSNDFTKIYYSSIDRVLHTAEAKCNHVIGFGADQIHFTEKDLSGHIQINGYDYFFITIN